MDLWVTDDASDPFPLDDGSGSTANDAVHHLFYESVGFVLAVSLCCPSFVRHIARLGSLDSSSCGIIGRLTWCGARNV